MNNLKTKLGWEVVERPVYTNNKVIENYKSISRNDNHRVLNIAKESYTVADNSLFEEVVYRLKEISGYDLAGFSEYQGGRKVLAFLKNPERVKIADWPVEDFMVVGNSHDYSTGFFIGTSNRIIRCQNEFSSISKHNVVHHTKSLEIKLDQVISYYVERQKVANQFELWNGISMSPDIKEMLVSHLFETDPENCSTKMANKIADLNRSIDVEVDAMGSNLFGLFNGVTFYTTHVMKQKEKCHLNVLGSGQRLNTKAYDYLKQVVF